MHILLVEPEYYSRYPPLGLLKLASYHRNRNDTVEYVRGRVVPKQSPDKIYITSLFSWAWQPVWAAVKHYSKLCPQTSIHLGGLYASLMPEHAKQSGDINLHAGIFDEADNLMPAYDLVPSWDASIIQASRGCNNTCPYCAVWRIEGKIKCTKQTIKPLIYPNHKRIVLWDNNILQSPHWKTIFDELIWYSQEKGMVIDFNQGLDARLIDEEAAKKISRMKTFCVRISYDNIDQQKCIRRAIDLLNAQGMRRRHICAYMLFNYKETPDEFFERVKDVFNSGAVAVPLRFQPLDTLKYNSYIGTNWDSNRLQLFARFRRVCGFGGVLPPYKWIVERFNSSRCFDEAFVPPERNGSLTVRAHKDYFDSWRKEESWNVVTQEFLAKTWK